jgi:hypothetical protein
MEPFAWLKETLEKIPNYNIQKLKELVPGNKNAEMMNYKINIFSNSMDNDYSRWLKLLKFLLKNQNEPKKPNTNNEDLNKNTACYHNT